MTVAALHVHSAASIRSSHLTGTRQGDPGLPWSWSSSGPAAWTRGSSRYAFRAASPRRLPAGREGVQHPLPARAATYRVCTGCRSWRHRTLRPRSSDAGANRPWYDRCTAVAPCRSADHLRHQVLEAGRRHAITRFIHARIGLQSRVDHDRVDRVCPAQSQCCTRRPVDLRAPALLGLALPSSVCSSLVNLPIADHEQACAQFYSSQTASPRRTVPPRTTDA
jgi:hypothetical protein